jgi:uncharacterized membrane protein
LQKIKPENFFIVFASIFGLCFLLLSPPFQSPDELNHFCRAWHISQGSLFTIKQDNRTGAFLPSSIEEISRPFRTLSGSMHTKIKGTDITDAFKIQLNPGKKQFYDLADATGINSFISYLPQATAIFILRIFNLPPLFILYGTRIFTLLCWICAIFFTIKLFPCFKWFLVLAALLPMSVYINSSVSADVMTNIISFLFTAIVFRLIYTDALYTKKEFIRLCMLVALLASVKFVYAPVALLCLLIPIKKCQGITFVTRNLTIAVIALLTVLLWTGIMKERYIPYHAYNPLYRDNSNMVAGADMHLQLSYILSHGTYIFKVFGNSVVKAFDMYFEGYIGTFGWLDTRLPILFIYAAYGLLFFAAITGGVNGIRVKPLHRAVFLFIATSAFCLLLLVQHLSWDIIGGDAVYTIQGRYLIPVAPFFFLMFNVSKFSLPKILPPVVIIFSTFSLLLSMHILYKRYYVPAVFETTIINCDSETVTNDNHYTTDNAGIFLENGATQSNGKARSGTHSALLTPVNPFAFTYRIRDCDVGDMITVEVWRFGKGGGIIISGEEDSFYQGIDISAEKDLSGWEKIHLNFLIQKHMSDKETGIYLFNNSTDSSYFDDFIITYKKLK